MKKVSVFIFSVLGFVSSASAFAETPLQCVASLESTGVTIKSRVIFDGNNPSGTSFNYIQTYNISVYKYLDENSIERVGFTANGSFSGFAGFVGYPTIQLTPWVVSFGIRGFGTLQISCEKI